ncbi:MAG TPA: hypothetical protein VHX88_06830 [Solirubrobacteraceae bacterium]|jgi:sugar lactone lactonase YvrE|nr:hypothetical protein [Solirubrobacteraceae bacterium]
MRAAPTTIGALVALLVGALAAPAATLRTRVLAPIPSPGFPASSLVAPDGTIYVGTFENPLGDNLPSKVFAFSPTGALERTYTMTGQDLSQPHGVQVAAIDGHGLLYLLEQSPSSVVTLNPASGAQHTYATFANVPSCSAAPAGAQCSDTLVDNAPEPDFAAWAPDGSLYVTDYQQALIWRVPPGGGAARVWFTTPLFDGLLFDDAGIYLEPDHDTLLVDTAASAPTTGTDFADGKLYSLPIEPDGQPGALHEIWESGAAQAPDGFAVAQSGDVYIPLVGPGSNAVVEISPDGHQLAAFPDPLENLLAPVPFDEPASATFDGDQLLTTNESYLAGDAAHQVLFETDVGEPGAPLHQPALAAATAPSSTPAAAPTRLRLVISPHVLRRGGLVRLRVAVFAGRAPVAGAVVRVLGRDHRTGRLGRVTVRLRVPRRGAALTITVRHAGQATASVNVRLRR